jgi:Tol biopolymer transport system component
MLVTLAQYREAAVAVTAPPRPPRSGDPVDREELEAREALIEEARQRARRRRRIYAASVALVALVGMAVFVVFERTGQSPSASPAPAASFGAASGTQRSKIAFVRLVKGARGESSYELYVMNADGSGKRRLARSPLAGFRAAPAWSPDGRKLAFAMQLRGSAGVCDRAGACNAELFVINADGSGLRRLTRNAVPDGNAAWSPDGRKVAFLSRRDGTGADVFVINADGSDQRNLTRKPGNEVAPAWSPDGRAIVFSAVPPGQPLWVGGSRSASGPYRDVYVMNADGSDQRNLTHTTDAEEWAAGWSPDGRTIAFAAYDGQSNRIFVINADGSGKRALTHELTPETFMSWSPDGRKIGFFDAGISVVNTDGSGLRRLARNVAFQGGPSWSPDGRKLIFVRLRHPRNPGGPATGEPPPPSPPPAADLWVMNADGSGQRNLTRTPTTSDGWSATWARSSGH